MSPSRSHPETVPSQCPTLELLTTHKETLMSCPFCPLFVCYQRQVARRLDTGTLAMSEDNARLLIHLAAQIRTVTGATLPEKATRSWEIWFFARLAVPPVRPLQ